MTERRILVVYGTRPEAIKLAPVIKSLASHGGLQAIAAVTGQHREMLDQVNALFRIHVAYDLNIIRPRQELQGLTARAVEGVTEVLRDAQPDAVVVQGDTTTSFAAALAAFYQQIPVVHVEAGLRTGNPYNPFPEEMNRRLTSQLTRLHLAPTATSRANLRREGVDPDAIVVTGNTVIDALLEVVGRRRPTENPSLDRIPDSDLVLITAHRRESWGEPMAQVANAVGDLARKFPEVTFLLPAHLNPVVAEVLLPPIRDLPNVLISEPLSYSDFSQVMNRSTLVLTDSGGVQEEAPSLGKPVLVMRENTERPEAVTAGTVRLVGTARHAIVDAVSTLLTDKSEYQKMANAVNPYGDGKAAERTAAAIAHMFGLGPRPREFEPRSS